MATQNIAPSIWLRRRSLLDRKHVELGRELEEKQEKSVPDYASALDDDIGDDLLH